MGVNSPSGQDSGVPRVYRPRPGIRVFLILAGLLLLGGAFFLGRLALFPVYGCCSQQSGTAAFTVLGGLALFAGLLGLYVATSSLRNRLILYPDAIEIENAPFGRRRLRLEDIAGRRQPNDRSILKLVPVEGRGKPLLVSGIYRRDALLDDWLQRLPDLDAADTAARTEALFASGKLGPDRERGMRRLAESRKMAGRFSLAGAAAGLWLILYPGLTAAMAANALLPLLGLALIFLSEGLYTIGRTYTDPRPDIALLVFFPALALALNAVHSYAQLDWIGPLAWALGGSAAFALTLAGGDREMRRKPASLLMTALGAGVPYAYGVSVLANTRFDVSPASNYQAEVVDKEHLGGRNPTWRVTLGAWGAQPYGETLDIARPYWYAVQIGDTVVVELHPGALGMAWYRLAPGKAAPIPFAQPMQLAPNKPAYPPAD